MLWALPQIWPDYKSNAYPYWSRYLLPLVQIALMSSVYCTIVMSWERYVRICIVSKLVSCTDYFSDGKFRLYLVFIVIFPILFYIPKFFEVGCHCSVDYLACFSYILYQLQPVDKIVARNMGLTCELFHEYLDVSHNISYLSEHEEWEMLQKCAALNKNETTDDWKAMIMMNVTFNSSIVSVDYTPLRKNTYYYNIYCIGINSLFASLFPFIALMFFNVSIALELKSLNKKVSKYVPFETGSLGGSSIRRKMNEENEKK